MKRYLALSVPLLALAAAVFAQSAGFTRLSEVKDLGEFTLVGVTDGNFRVQSGVIAASGKGSGYFATKKSYRNYVLRFDWKYARPEGLQRDADFDGASGVLLHITGEHRVWPKAVQVQLYNRDAGSIFGVGGAKARGTRDPAAQASAVKPVGEWNAEEITSQDGRIVCKINGVVVSEASNAEVKEGPIGWQYKGAEIHFRNIEVKELK
jgi:hypothetical protein